MTGGKALAGVAMVTEVCWEAEGVEEMVSDIANFLSRVPSSCNTAQWPIMFVGFFHQSGRDKAKNVYHYHAPQRSEAHLAQSTSHIQIILCRSDILHLCTVI